MQSAPSAEALASRLGDSVPDAIEQHESSSLEGIDFSLTLRPRDGEMLGRCLAALAAAGAAALVRGGGSRLGLANAAGAFDCVLETRALDAIDTFDAEDGVVHAGGGAPLAALRHLVAPEGWELPLDAWGPDATVGGVLSAAAYGPRLLGLGPPRDAVLGLDVVLASGVRTRCGGRVVKNVTGYDLAKLYTGAFGTLGVIEGAWLRLRPRPEETVRLVGWVAGLAEAQALGLALARRASARCVAVVAPAVARRVFDEGDAAGDGAASAGAFLFVVELAGDAVVVADDRRWLEARTPVERRDEPVDRVGALEGSSDAFARARLAVLPSAVARCAADLGEALLSFHPGTGLLYAGRLREEGTEPAAEAASLAEAIDRAGARSNACVVFESLPLSLRGERDVFGEPGPERRLMAALKERFDPRRTLNPGRSQGRL